MVSTDRDDRSCTMSTAGPIVPHTMPAAQRKTKPDQAGLPVLWSVGVDVTDAFWPYAGSCRHPDRSMLFEPVGDSASSSHRDEPVRRHLLAVNAWWTLAAARSPWLWPASC